MKPTADAQARSFEPATNWTRALRHWLGFPILCAVVLTLNACQPGGDSGDGIDPGVVEIPLAYIKRPIPVDDMGNEVQTDVREPRLFSSGGDVYLRSIDNEINITGSVTAGIGDVKGLNVNHDGTKLVFSLRLFDPDPNNPPFPSWNVYEYDLTTSQLRRLISSQLIAEEGDDLYPSYLPDGRIVFTSDRQKQSLEMQINEGRPRFASLDEDEGVQALVLHVMNGDGTDIHQISFNQSHDLYPQVLTGFQGGRIVFSRWDNAAGNDEINIYTVNPDGSDLQILYGSQSHNTGTGGAEIQFTNLREMENGDLMTITKPFDGTFDGGDIEVIGVDRFADINKPLWSLAGLPGPAQRPATISNVLNNGAISPNGRYATAFPLWDGSNRVLVSKSTCQLDVNNVIRPCIDPYLSDPAAVEVSPPYSIWLYDRNGNSQKPLVLAEAGKVITEAIALENRTRAPVIFDKRLLGELDSGWESEVLGVVNIKSVYDMGDGTFNGCFFTECTSLPGITAVQDFADPVNSAAVDRPARFVRFIKAVGIPDPDDPALINPPDLDNNAFGPQRNRGMRDIVGYAPVEPDGSVKVKVPAFIPLAIEVLDGEGRRIGPRHDNWFQVQAGDVLTCVGCHDPLNGSSPPEIHARSDGEAPSINSGLPMLPMGGIFVNTLIPGSTPASPYMGIPGQTMAEVRFDSVAVASQPRLSADLIFTDYWTDPGISTQDPDIAYLYSDLNPNMLRPTNNFCQPSWLYNCRVTINYPPHIHAIFQLDRGVVGAATIVDDITPMAPLNPPNNDPTNTPLVSVAVADGVGDNTCISCHTTVNGTRLPYGQLDLTTDPNQDPNDRFRSFQQLFNTRQGQLFNAGAMQLEQFTVPDGMGGTNPDPAAAINPIMTTAGARRSFFIEKMTGTELDAGRALPVGSVDHTNMLTDAELKLISEWIDLGAQNFNNPFDLAAPQN
jgi:hypothetical protein